MELGKFLGTTIAATLSTVVVVSVAIPVIGEAIIPEGTKFGTAIESMIGLVPLMLVVAIVVGVVAVAISKYRT